MMARKGLAALLVALLAIPAGASPSNVSPKTATPIGAISNSESARIAGTGVLPGTTVFSGDIVEVGPRGTAWVLLNSGMPVRVSAESRVRLVESDSTATGPATRQFEVEVLNGAARFRTEAKTPVLARLADATVRSKGAQPAVGLVSVLSAKTALIGAERGELLVSTAHDGKSVTLKEGEAVEVTLAPAPAKPELAGGGTGAPTLTGNQVAILGGTIVLIISLLAIKLASDHKSLTDTQKKNAVSPFQFP